MLFFLALAAGALALAVAIGQANGHHPEFCRGAVGWSISAALMAGAAGLFVYGRVDETLDRRGQAEADGAVNAEIQKVVVTETSGVPGTPKTGGVTSPRGQSKKGGKKKGGWGRRSDGPVVPLTPEREKTIAALRAAGATLQARGGQVVRLQLAGEKITDTHMSLLEGLSGTRSFILSAPRVTEDSLAPLATMTGLTELDFTGTRITDATLKHLAGMTALTNLTLTDQEITDDGAVLLARLTSLATLDLKNTKLTDKGVARLAGLKSLTRLVLSGTEVGDEGLGTLVGIKGMKQLELSHTNITDAAVDHLLKFRNAELFRVTRGEGGISDKAIGRIKVDLRTAVVRYSAVNLKGKLRDGAASGGE